MSLKTYIDGQAQAFKKQGNASLKFSVQGSSTFNLLPIHGAFKSGSTNAVTSIDAVEISPMYPFCEIDRISLPADLIYYDQTKGQYLVDRDKTFSTLKENKIYYLEFKNGYNNFETEAFYVQKNDYPLTFDLTVVTWDSDLITFDQTKINI